MSCPYGENPSERAGIFPTRPESTIDRFAQDKRNGAAEKIHRHFPGMGAPLRGMNSETGGEIL